jgi:hypothetical protein
MVDLELIRPVRIALQVSKDHSVLKGEPRHLLFKYLDTIFIAELMRKTNSLWIMFC